MMTNEPLSSSLNKEPALIAGDNAPATGRSRVPVPADFAGNAMLRSSPKDKIEHMQYAAQVLLDSMGLHIPIKLTEVKDDRPCGLELPGDTTIQAAELQEVFDCLSLTRERETGRRDRLGRFDEAAAIWDVSKPWVDLRAMELAESFEGQGRTEMKREHSFSVHITHDVDRTTFLEPLSVLNSLLGRVGLRPGRTVPLRKTLATGALIKGIERLLDYERSQGIRARFFLMSGPYGMGRYSTRTDARWSSWRTIAELIQDAGMEIGLHGSFHARARNSYRQEKEKLEHVLGRPVTTHRNHYLRFDPERVSSQLETAGIEHDFSIGYVSRMGFRAGSAKIHRTFDLLHQRQSRLLSVPLIFMDSHLIVCDPDAVFRELIQALEEVKKVDGCVSLLFHPEVLLTDPNAWPFFERVVCACGEMGADLSGGLP